MTEAALEPELRICDPHHHLWDHPGDRYLLPELLEDLTAGHKVVQTVFVECGVFYRAAGPERLRPVGEVAFAGGQAAMAASGRFGDVLACAGIVGRADLREGAAVEDVLQNQIRVADGRFKGVRHTGAYDEDPEVFPAAARAHTIPQLYADPKFREGAAKLGELGLSFEAAQFFHQLDELAALADAVPHLQIMLNHVGAPVGIGRYAGAREEVFAVWRRGVLELAKRPNVFVKLGGLGMTVFGFGFEHRKTPPSSAELAQAWRPYLETCIEAFGPDRGAFESNFPVDRASCDYVTLWNAFKRVAAGASADEKAALFAGTAQRFYRLD